MISRRAVICGVALAGWSLRADASPGLPPVLVTKDPNCGCCTGWVKHLTTAGLTVKVTDTNEIDRVKARLGVPSELWACHTAEIGRYVVEGHVPVSAIQKLFRDMPAAIGLAVPGMPVGSPGMEVDGAQPETYTVYVFDKSGHRPFAKYKGTAELSG
jgi:hypothetical protein